MQTVKIIAGILAILLFICACLLCFSSQPQDDDSDGMVDPEGYDLLKLGCIHGFLNEILN